jgi:hypothetical protein
VNFYFGPSNKNYYMEAICRMLLRQLCLFGVVFVYLGQALASWGNQSCVPIVVALGQKSKACFINILAINGPRDELFIRAFLLGS